jgi:hypothetical protein
MAWLLNWILKRVTFNLYSSATPYGTHLGGHDVIGVTDSYIILTLSISGIIAFTGHFQTT